MSANLPIGVVCPWCETWTGVKMLRRGVNALFVCTDCNARFSFKVEIHREVLEEGKATKKAKKQ